MKRMKLTFLTLLVLMMVPLKSCRNSENKEDLKILFLHHSTGGVIWNGTPSIISRIVYKLSPSLSQHFHKEPPLPVLFKKFNKRNNKNYLVEELTFPKMSPYGWNNYPFDYYNIWVKNAGNSHFMEEPTLEILTRSYKVIIFKHCFPVSNIQPDDTIANINSDVKSIANYKLQYNALKNKLKEFPDTKFILFTGPVKAKADLSEEEALRAKEFVTWVINEWDSPDDNIYLWDLYSLETEGGLYLKDSYAYSQTDSHPNSIFAGRAVKLLFNRIIDVIETDGKSTGLSGEKL